MTNGSTIVSTLSQILGALTPQQISALGNHLTQANEMRAMQILTTMEANPSLAATMLPSLTGIPNLPPQVMTWVTAALQPGETSATFQENMAQAIAAVQAAATSAGILGNLGL